MLLELQSDGTAVVTRGTTFQGQSGSVFIIGTFESTPITPVANMVMEYNITRPDGEQSGWQTMAKVASELRWYYGLQGWDTAVNGTAKVALRWYDVSLVTPIYTVTQEYDMIIKKGVIAQPVGIDDENYNTLIALIPALQTNKMDFYDISSPELLPPAVTYEEDGLKTANAFYYPFAKTVNLYNSVDTLETSGTLYVTKNETAMRQYEYLFAGNGKNTDSPQIFTRQISYDSEGAVTMVGSFRQVDTDVYFGLKQVTDAIEADITSLENTKQDKTDENLETTSKQVVGGINELNANKLNKNFSALVERTYLQLQDWVALQSGNEIYKISLERLRHHLTQNLVGLSFDIVDTLPSTGMGNIFYLEPLADSIEHYPTYADLPGAGSGGAYTTNWLPVEPFGADESESYTTLNDMLNAGLLCSSDYTLNQTTGEYEQAGTIYTDITELEGDNTVYLIDNLGFIGGEINKTLIKAVLVNVDTVTETIGLDSTQEVGQIVEGSSSGGGISGVLYITDDNGARYQWDEDTSAYVTYSLGYSEHIWLNETSAFEQIGTTAVDLTGYTTQTWVTDNFATKSEFNGLVESLNGGTTGQILAKASNDNLDVEWVEKPTAPIQEVQVNGVEVEPVGGVVDIPTIAVNGVDYVRDPAKTYLVIKQDTAGEFQLLTQTTGTNNFTVDWGDGETEAVTTLGAISHTYADAGMYLITIDGTFAGFYVNYINTYANRYIEVYGGTNYTSIKDKSFADCNNLRVALFPYVTIIDDYAFVYCNNLIKLEIPKATTISQRAFRECSNLTKLYMPKATNVDRYAFYICDNLTNVEIPNATIIGECVFYNCTNLKELTIGNVTTTSASNSFGNVTLDKLTISGNPNDTDIARILNLFTTSGGTFSNSATIQYSGQVSKVPTLDNDVTNKSYVDTQDAATLASANSYDNSTSGLTATTKQGAIDELADDISNISGTTLSDNLDAPSSSVGLSTKGAYELLQQRLNPDKTYILFNASAGDNTLYLNCSNIKIDKGDGSAIQTSNTAELVPTYNTLNYTNAGLYLITLSGSFDGNGAFSGLGSFGVTDNLDTAGQAEVAKIIKVWIGDNVASSSGEAILGFRYATNLESFEYLGNAVTSINSIYRSRIFQGCTKLKKVKHIGTTFGDYQYSNSGLEEIEFISDISSSTLGTYTFSNTNLKRIELPKGITFGTSSFNGVDLDELIVSGTPTNAELATFVSSFEASGGTIGTTKIAITNSKRKLLWSGNSNTTVDLSSFGLINDDILLLEIEIDGDNVGIITAPVGTSGRVSWTKVISNGAYIYSPYYSITTSTLTLNNANDNKVTMTDTPTISVSDDTTSLEVTRIWKL